MNDERPDVTDQLLHWLGERGRNHYPPTVGVSLSHVTGLKGGYLYSAISAVPPKVLERYCCNVSTAFRGQINNDCSREEWMVRTHVAVKVLLGATVMMTSAHYAAAKRLRIVEPYLLYYALFNTARALVLLVPEEQWKDGAILDVTHTKVLNVTADQLRRLSVAISEKYVDLARQALAAREFFSYKFPAQGLRGDGTKLLPEFNQLLTICRFIAEVAQLNSECLELSFADRGEPYGVFEEAPLKRFYTYQHRFEEISLHDSDDYYRLGSLLRRLGRPVSLEHTATDGLVEDFYSGWDFGDEEDHYRPKHWGLILSL